MDNVKEKIIDVLHKYSHLDLFNASAREILTNELVEVLGTKNVNAVGLTRQDMLAKIKIADKVVPPEPTKEDSEDSLEKVVDKKSVLDKKPVLKTKPRKTSSNQKRIKKSKKRVISNAENR